MFITRKVISGPVFGALFGYSTFPGGHFEYHKSVIVTLEQKGYTNKNQNHTIKNERQIYAF